MAAEPLTDAEVSHRIAAFRQSIASDLYSPSSIVDFAGASAAVSRYDAEIAVLNEFAATGLDLEALARAIHSSQRLYALVCSLLSIGSGIDLEDGRALPDPGQGPRSNESAQAAAAILLELGLSRLLEQGIDVRKLLLVQQIAADAAKRRQRVDLRFRDRLIAAVSEAMDAVSESGEWELEPANLQTLPFEARRVVDFAVAVNGKPRIAVASTFQAYSGGRQSRDISNYSSVQQRLRSSGMALVLVADGKGMRATSDRILRNLFSSVPDTMSIKQAENGGLREAFSRLAPPPAAPTIDAAGVRRLIGVALAKRLVISSDALPLSPREASLAIATYASENSHLALDLSPDGSQLGWHRGNLLSKLRSLRDAFVQSEAIEVVGDLFGANLLPCHDCPPTMPSAIATLGDDSVFTEPFVLGAYDGVPSPAALRDFSRFALKAAQQSRLSLLLMAQPLSESRLSELRRAQPFMPTNVITVDIETCISIAEGRDNPRDRLRTISLGQADLSKISPFVVRSVTPRKAFFGREEEAQILRETLTTNSVALLGGRRIGKTSLMKNIFEALGTGGRRPFFADCQVVKTWANFGALAAREWGVRVPDDFRPNDLFQVVADLRQGSDEPVILLLDEIDQLLQWDRTHEEDEVPEAFFRACRAISQQALAQFVFSGERTIANTMWDPSSPHWNFCRPLMLQQLTRSASYELIETPLRGLGIRLVDRDSLLEACWSATDGHPELLQFLGDKLIGQVNERDRSDVFVSIDDVHDVTNNYEYAEQYLETYWGQSPPGERIISLMVVAGCETVDEINAEIGKKRLLIDAFRLQEALRMLELYGIIRKSAAGYELRALWFSTALNFYGGLDATAARYKEALTQA